MCTTAEKVPILEEEVMPDYLDPDVSSLDDRILPDEVETPKVPIFNQAAPDFNGSNAGSVSSSDCNAYDQPYVQIETEIYWYRWYILGLFSLLAMSSNLGWNTWGPIETSARATFRFSRGTISLLSDWGAITFIIAVFPSAYIIDVLGLRKATIMAGSFLTLGSGLRCIFTYKDKSKATILINAGQICIGLCGPVSQAAATAISSTWFPPKQRTTATAIGSLASYCGTALSFMLGPHLVDDIDECHYTPGSVNYDNYVENVGDQIMHYLYIQCGFVGFLLFLIFVSYPAKPPKPPSASANVERINFKDGLKRLLKNPQFQLIAFAYGISTGVYSAWCSDFAINLKSFDIGDKTAGMLGFWAVIAGSASGISLSIMGDKLGALKLILILLFIVAIASFSVFSLMCMKIIPGRLALYYMTCIFGGLTVNGSIPLFFELAVESSYPVAEGINTGFMTFSNNVYCTIFLSLPLINGVGTQWMNWFLVASCVACIPAMLLFKERYHRLTHDFLVENKSGINDDESMKYPGINGDLSGLSLDI